MYVQMNHRFIHVTFFSARHPIFGVVYQAMEGDSYWSTDLHFPKSFFDKHEYHDPGKDTYFCNFVDDMLFKKFPIDCIFPLERDVAKMTGLSLSKTWMIFMEKRAWTCGNSFLRQRSSALMDFFICLTFRNYTSKLCLVTGYYLCILRVEEPNIVRTLSDSTRWERTVSIKVHQQFHINGTVSRFRYVDRGRDETEESFSANFMELILNGSKHR